MGHFLGKLASKVQGAVHSVQNAAHETHTDGLLSEVLAGGQHAQRKAPLSQEEMAEFLEDGPAPSARKAPLSQEEMAEFLEDGPAPSASKPPLSPEEMAEYLE